MFQFEISPTNNREKGKKDFWKVFEEQKVLLGVVFLGLILIGAGVFLGKSKRQEPEEIKFVSSEEERAPSTQSGQVLVDVSGAVKTPGVYSLNGGARVGEAIEAAGGLSEKANSTWIEKNLNLAAPLSDGAKIYVPYQGEGSIPSSSGAVGGTKISGTVNINTASASELETLPEIGPTFAQKIIEYRKTHGNFKSTKEITNVSGIGPKTFEKIKDKISVN